MAAKKINQITSSCELSQQSITYLGLSKQPFAAEILSDDSFFKTPASDKIIENLTHQIQFSDLILIVEGPHGSGKTSLFRQFIQTDINNTKALSLQAEATDTMTQLQQKMSLHMQDLGDANYLEDNLKSLQMFDQTPLIIIDSCHVLSDTTLQELLRYQTQLKQEHEVNLKILLFANTGMSETLQKVTDLQAEQMYVQNMPAFSAKQIQNFIMHRLARADYTGEPLFDDSNLQPLIKKCDGTPLSIMSLAAPMLDKIIGQTVNPATAGWIKSLALVSVLLVAATAAAAYFGLFNNLLNNEVELIDTASSLPDITSPAFETEASTNLYASNETTESPTIKDADIDIIEALEEDKPLSDTHTQASTIAVDTIDSKPQQTIEAIPAEPAEKESVISDTPAIQTAALDKPAVEVMPQSKPLEVAPAVPATIKKPVIKPATSLHPSLLQLNKMGIQDANWLKQQPSNAWTLQLLGARDPETLLKFVRRHQLGAATAWYKTWLSGKPYYVLVHGSFTGRDIARTSISKLPSKVRALKPWVKSMKSVQQAIK